MGRCGRKGRRAAGSGSPATGPASGVCSVFDRGCCHCCAGKVHGSLARAGKVRGQTPKVPKQEKKKKPTGRAMKRIKYNRRFVNVGECLGSVGSRHRALEACTGSALLPLLLLHVAAAVHVGPACRGRQHAHIVYPCCNLCALQWLASARRGAPTASNVPTVIQQVRDCSVTVRRQQLQCSAARAVAGAGSRLRELATQQRSTWNTREGSLGWCVGAGGALQRGGAAF